MASIESHLKLSYLYSGCKLSKTGNCAAGAGQKKICEKVYIHAPAYQVLLPDSLRGGQHIKVGPVLETPTTAWFRVGKTGHGENWGTATALSRFSEEGAAEKARLDVDAIRRVLVQRGLPTDRPPPVIEKPKNPSKPKQEAPKPLPAKLDVKYRVRPGNKNFFDVRISNTGGSPETISFRIWFLDGFSQIHSPEWKDKDTLSFTLSPGETWEGTFHDFHVLEWYFERLQTN